MGTFNDIKNDIYATTNGKIRLGSLRTEGGRNHIIVDISRTTWNYASQGARDVENNAIYDTKVRLQKTAAVVSVASAIFLTSDNTNQFNKINWNCDKVKRSMERMGVLETASQNAANEMLKNAVFINEQGNPVALSGTKF